MSLTGQHRVYLDANILIHLVQGLVTNEVQLRRLAAAIDNKLISSVTSELSLAEVLVRPTALGDLKSIAAFKYLVGGGSNVVVAPVSRSILIGAANVRTEHKLKLPDAIHLSTALALNCEFFLSRDGDFNSITVPHVVQLADLDP
jgi:predicted nucleic acid-binding protein